MWFKGWTVSGKGTTFSYQEQQKDLDDVCMIEIHQDLTQSSFPQSTVVFYFIGNYTNFSTKNKGDQCRHQHQSPNAVLGFRLSHNQLENMLIPTESQLKLMKTS